MPAPADPRLYELIRRRVYRRYPRHSAYRSGRLVQEYKAAYRAEGRRGPAYLGRPSNRAGLRRWFAEEWRNQRGGVGYAGRSDVYRPTKRITAATPLTFGELTRAELERARRAKSLTGRVRRFRPDPGPEVARGGPKGPRPARAPSRASSRGLPRAGPRGLPGPRARASARTPRAITCAPRDRASKFVPRRGAARGGPLGQRPRARAPRGKEGRGQRPAAKPAGGGARLRGPSGAGRGRSRGKSAGARIAARPGGAPTGRRRRRRAALPRDRPSSGPRGAPAGRPSPRRPRTVGFAG